VHFALFNVVTDRLEPSFDPAPDTLHRVELPPRFTLEARVPAGTLSVKFSVLGKEIVDNAAPFRLTEDAQGKAQPWEAASGSHEVAVATFASADGTGMPVHEFSQTIQLSAVGMAEAFTPMDQAGQDAWIAANLDQVLEPKMFTGSAGMLPYRLYTPEHYDASVKYPVLVYLHQPAISRTAVDRVAELTTALSVVRDRSAMRGHAGPSRMGALDRQLRARPLRRFGPGRVLHAARRSVSFGATGQRAGGVVGPESQYRARARLPHG
jgi:hypothetical protein